MKVKLYRLIEDCIERGVEYGYNHAHKHTDTPDPHSLKQEIETACLNEICEYIEFHEEVQ